MDGARWLTTPSGRAWITYQRATHLLEVAVDQHLRSTSGLSHAEFEILARLASTPDGRLRMGALADRVIAPKSRLNYQISQLADRGLVEREPHPTDRRGLYAVITPLGVTTFQHAVPGLIDTVEQHFTQQMAGGEQEQLTAFLQRVGDSVLGDAGGSNCRDPNSINPPV